MGTQGSGEGAHPTLLRHIHYLESYSHTEAGVGLPQKPKDLRVSTYLESGVWSWGEWGCVCYSVAVRNTI